MTVSPKLLEQNLKSLFPFELDEFQLQAIAALEAGRSVVVCAPTGSGKTLIGEYTIHRALQGGGRIFYTTPLKALSNQKLRDFRELFGSHNVGLLTGDMSIDRDAPILVMTTEIFRNMLYGTSIGAVGTSLTGVEAVVLDECHYMNDRARGTVWEESIIYCPPEIQLVALSATVANASQLTDWIEQVHGPTELIYSNYRPVPLGFYFCNSKGLFPLLNRKQNKINPRLLRNPSKGRGGKNRDVPNLGSVLTHLRERDMLPAIYFIFSRRGCDRAVEEVSELNLVNPGEARVLRQKVEEFLRKNPEAERVGQVKPLLQGIAAHHAGILPTWKGFVEELFQQGLIKVVFATETLAAGINMPARTTVISSLSKRTDDGHRLLKASEFLQMSGRAGRRGMDERGHVVTVQTRFEGAREAAYLATVGPDPLVSQFTPTYGMVLNLLQTHSLEETKELVESSFGQYIATMHLQPKLEELEELEQKRQQMETKLAEVDEDLCKGYQKLRERLKAEKRLLKTLEVQALETNAAIAAQALPTSEPGQMLSLKGRHISAKEPILAVLIGKVPGSGQSPNLICLGKNNRWYVASSSDVVALHEVLPQWGKWEVPEPPVELILKPGQSRKGNEETAAIAQAIPDSLESFYAPEVEAQAQRLAAVQEKLKTHPLNKYGDPGSLLKLEKRCQKLDSQIEKIRSGLDRQLSSHWDDFLALIHILLQVGCLRMVENPPEAEEEAEETTPSFDVTEIGESAAAIRGDNELWLGLALMSGSLNGLGPHQFAAACAALVTEVSRPDTWTSYQVSPPVKNALSQLQGLRRKLFQIQHRHDVTLPIWLERELIGLVEEWALGVEWSELCAHTTLDEGDIVRILRRTLDFLSQVPHVPHIYEELKTNAYRAIQLLDRFPVNETIEQP
ncbi:DEAD/DEAH box helicase [Phormidium sp. CCY1219]|uniref:DEAD/DEAH box helicase n=1 Tax=Phormidium sp. CCY1219 TaxID=2886104 RepID=UPI002D1E567B|nr:DEAD/DEAH box helicase [Phormidium sp. CCY1219]MEB3831546.1 DEAD/DEAH box helicase [Phormidium sp. CCY1219]